MSEIKETLKERGERYGEFRKHAEISQGLKSCMVFIGSDGWSRLDCDQKEALEMIQHKIARILNGDPNYKDSWHDIAGYATLISERLSDG